MADQEAPHSKQDPLVEKVSLILKNSQREASPVISKLSHRLGQLTSFGAFHLWYLKTLLPPEAKKKQGKTPKKSQAKKKQRAPKKKKKSKSKKKKKKAGTRSTRRNKETRVSSSQSELKQYAKKVKTLQLQAQRLAYEAGVASETVLRAIFSLDACVGSHEVRAHRKAAVLSLKQVMATLDRLRARAQRLDKAYVQPLSRHLAPYLDTASVEESVLQSKSQADEGQRKHGPESMNTDSSGTTLQAAANKKKEEEGDEEGEQDAVKMVEEEEQSAACGTKQPRTQQQVAMEETDLADAPESQIEEQEEAPDASRDLSQEAVGRGSKRQAPALSRIETAVATLAASQPHLRFRPQVRASLTSDSSGVLVAARLPGVTAQNLSLRLTKQEDVTSPTLILCGLRHIWQPERRIEHDPFMTLFGGYDVRPKKRRTTQWFHEQIDLSLPVSIARAFQIAQNQAVWQVRLGRDGSLNMLLPFEHRHNKAAQQVHRRDEDMRRASRSGQYRHQRQNGLFDFLSQPGGQHTDYLRPALFGF